MEDKTGPEIAAIFFSPSLQDTETIAMYHHTQLERIDTWKDCWGQISGWVGRWMKDVDEWMGGWVAAWVNRWVDRWIIG